MEKQAKNIQNIDSTHKKNACHQSLTTKSSIKEELINQNNNDTLITAKTDNKLMRKNFIWNTIGLTLYASTSLFFLIMVTRINGVEDAGIFTFAFSFVCMIQVVGLYAGRTYQVTDRDKRICDSDFLKFRIINCLVMFLAAIIFCFTKDYSIYKNSIIIILLLYKIIDAFSESFYGIFQKHNNLYQVGISLFLRSAGILIGFLIIDLITHNLPFSCVAIVIIDIAVFLFYDLKTLKKYRVNLKKLSLKTFKILAIGGLSVFLFTFLSQYLVNAPKFAIDNLLGEEEQAIFGIILMPATVMLLCSQLIINPFLYDINKTLKKQNYKAFLGLIIKVCLCMIGIGIVALVVCWFLGIPVLNLIYGLDLSLYLMPLMIIISGSIIFGIASVISNGLIALRKNNIQVFIYIISSIAISFFSYIFIKNFGLEGASYAYFLAMCLLLLLYILTFAFIYKKISNTSKIE